VRREKKGKKKALGDVGFEVVRRRLAWCEKKIYQISGTNLQAFYLLLICLIPKVSCSEFSSNNVYNQPD